MAEAVYVLCAATSVFCAVLLHRGWRASGRPLLFWSALCFACLAVNNLLLVVDLVIFPSVDLALYRTGVALVGMGVLLLGLVWDAP